MKVSGGNTREIRHTDRQKGGQTGKHTEKKSVIELKNHGANSVLWDAGQKISRNIANSLAQGKGEWV